MISLSPSNQKSTRCSSPIVKLDLTDELAEKVENDTLDNGTSRQKVIQHAVERYYADEVGARDFDLLKKELETKELLLQLKTEEYVSLNDKFEWLRGQYDMVTTKLLVAALKEPWWVRLGRRFRRKP